MKGLRATGLALSVVLSCSFIFPVPTQAWESPPAIILSEDGVWTWFNDPRAVFKDGHLYFGVMRSDGRAALNFIPSVTGGASSTLWASSWVEKDDHNNPGLLPLQDGRLMAFYARHGTNVTSFQYRVSNGTNPVSPSDWGVEQTYTSKERISYANPYQLLSESGRIYFFMRNLNYNPTLITSDDFGKTWSEARILIQTGKGGAIRPYVKYASNGVDRIDFLYTDGHPRDEDNSLYHAYYQNGSLYQSDGTLIKSLDKLPLKHDSAERGSVVYAYSASNSQDPNESIPKGRAWCSDLTYDPSGHPVAVFSVQRDEVTGGDWSDDRIYYYYARWVPGSGWQKRFIAHAGRPLYESEDDYPGGIAVDPRDPNVIYISTNASDPFALDETKKVALNSNARYELYRGVTKDGGMSFEWTALTANSTEDNLRPYVPRGNTYACGVTWFAGRYTAYTDYKTRVMGLFVP